MASGFKMKSWSQVTASLVNWFAGAQTLVSDLNVGSVARTLLEAVASELAEVYYRIFTALDVAQREAVYESFDFQQKAATAAAGVLLWQRSTLATSDILIASGSQVAVPATVSAAEVAFASTADATLPARTTLTGGGLANGTDTSATVASTANLGVGDVLLCQSEKLKITAVAGLTVSLTRGYGGTTAASHAAATNIGVVGKAVTVTATVAGAAGNVLDGTVSKINTPVTGIETVTNEAVFTGGSDEETEDARKKRFTEFVSGLARGTKGAIEFGSKSVPGVVSAKAIDLDDDNTLNPGFVNLYIADAAGTADSTLITAVNTELENWRPAGVKVTTTAPSIVSVNITASVKIDPTYAAADVLAAVQQRLTDFFARLGMGDDVYVALLYQTVVDSNPSAILNATITAPSGDTAIANNQIARPGTITLTAV